MAVTTGRREDTVYWHLKRIYHKLDIFPAGGPGTAGAVGRRVSVTALWPADYLRTARLTAPPVLVWCLTLQCSFRGRLS